MSPQANEDYYFLPDGRLVFTEAYHLKRGYCCASGCRHCPYEYANVPEPKRSVLIAQKIKDGLD
jgi:hypothetical protein